MDKIQELRDRRSALREKAQEILTSAKDGILAEDEEKRFDELEAEIAGLGKTIDRMERMAKIEAEAQERKLPQTVETGDSPDEEKPQEKRKKAVDKAGILPHMTWQRRTVRYFNALATGEDDPETGRSLMNQLRRDVANMPAEQRELEHREAVDRIDKHPLLTYEQRARLKGLLPERRTITTASGDTLGGDSLLPAPFLAEVFILTEQYGVARQIFRTIPFSGPGNTLSLKNLVTDPMVYWVGQGELIPPSDAKFADDLLVLNKLAGVTSWVTEAEEDMIVSLLPILTQRFAERIAEAEDRAGLIGDGTATYGGYTGVLNAPGATVVHTGGTTGEVTEADLRAVKQSVSRSRRGNARWLMHESVMDQVRQLENTAGYRLFTEPPTQEGATMLLGYPVTFAEALPTATGVSGNDEPILAFGDFSRILMAIKRGMTADVSREGILQNPANGDIIYNAYQADGALLRVTERIGFASPTALRSTIAVLQTEAGDDDG